MFTELSSLRAVIVDDHEMVRQALAAFLQDSHRIKIVRRYTYFGKLGAFPRFGR